MTATTVTLINCYPGNPHRYPGIHHWYPGIFHCYYGNTACYPGNADCGLCVDVAVGAPQENDLQGAVYIYNGRKTGLGRDYSQVGTLLSLLLSLSPARLLCL